MTDTKGIFYGVGVGPGDPELMTLKAVKIIGQCSVIVLPSKSREDCYAYKIAKEVVPEIDEKIILPMDFPMTKDEEKLTKAYDLILATIEKYLAKGMDVAFLTIGDPTVYSTYIYIHYLIMNSGYNTQIISGIPSFCAGAARLGISLGEQSQEIHIIPGTYPVEKTLFYKGTCVYMKSGKKLHNLIKLLEESSIEEQNSKSLEVYGISNCGMENEKVYYGLEEAKKAEGYLTILIVKRQ